MPVKPSPHSPDDELGRLVGLSLSRQQADRDGNGGEPCLDAEVLASYADGGLSAAARADADRHLAACGWCRRALLFQAEGAEVGVGAAVDADAPEVDDAHEDAHVELRPAITGSPAAGPDRQPSPERQPGKVIAWPGVRRAARTWLPLAATVIVAAGLWFTLRTGIRQNAASPTASVASTADRSAPPPAAADASRRGEVDQQAKADDRLREVIIDTKVKGPASRPFAAEEASRRLADKARGALKDEQGARAASPTFRTAAPAESTMARAKTEPQPPSAPKPNTVDRVGGLVGGQAAAPPPPPPRQTEGFLAGQAQGRAAPAPAAAAPPPASPQQTAERTQAKPAQEVPTQNAQATVNASPNTINSQYQVSGPTNTQSNVNVNQANGAQNAGTQNAANQNAAASNAANQRAGASGDRAGRSDRDESRREAPQRAANESPAPASAGATAAPAGPARQADAAKAAAAPPATTAGDAGAGASEGKVANAGARPGAPPASAPAAGGAPAVGAEAGAAGAGAGAGARTADTEAGNKPVDVMAKRTVAPPPAARPAGGASTDDGARERGRALDPEVTVVTSPFPNVLRSLNGRRWWRIRDGNTIEGSVDGGFTWTVEYSDPEARITRGAVTRADDCWMIGAKGLVLRFQPGRGWTRIAAPTTRALVSVTAISAIAATVTDDGGQRYQTTDGGLTWQPAR